MIPEGALDPAVGGLTALCIALFIMLLINGFQLKAQREQFEGQIARSFTRGKIHGAEMERRRQRNSRRREQRTAQAAAKQAVREVQDAS